MTAEIDPVTEIIVIVERETEVETATEIDPEIEIVIVIEKEAAEMIVVIETEAETTDTRPQDPKMLMQPPLLLLLKIPMLAMADTVVSMTENIKSSA